MDAAEISSLNRRVPVATLLMLGGAVIVAMLPRWSSWLIYDRSAILSGQLWRMFTGHWVHFSVRHLVYDAIPLVVAGSILELRGIPRFRWFCLLTPLFISACALVFEPQMNLCGGLSGLATAMIALLALDGLSENSWWRWICAATLLAIAAKILREFSTGRSLFLTIEGAPAFVSVTSHAAGAIAALIFYSLSKSLPRARRPQAHVARKTRLAVCSLVRDKSAPC